MKTISIKKKEENSFNSVMLLTDYQLAMKNIDNKELYLKYLLVLHKKLLMIQTIALLLLKHASFN